MPPSTASAPPGQDVVVVRGSAAATGFRRPKPAGSYCRSCSFLFCSYFDPVPFNFLVSSKRCREKPDVSVFKTLDDIQSVSNFKVTLIHIFAVYVWTSGSFESKSV